MYNVYCLIKSVDAYDREEPISEILFSSNRKSELEDKLLRIINDIKEESESSDSCVKIIEWDNEHLYISTWCDTYEYYRIVKM